MCWNSGVRKRLKLCSMMKMRKKSGLRRAQRMYQGRAVKKKDARAAGWKRRKASRQRLVKSAQKKMAPAERMMAAGPLARTARPRKKPKRMKASQGVRGRIAVCSLRVRPRTTAAQTMAMVSMALKGMSVAAACEKPIMPTVVGRRSSSHPADSPPQPRGCFAHAEELEAKCRAPVEERRLLKPRLSIEARGDPIAGLGHVARDPGVARLVRPDEADGAKMAEVADVERGCDENGPANSSGGAGARVLGNWSGCFGHGKLSLTSNYYLPAADLLHTVARRGTRANLG